MIKNKALRRIFYFSIITIILFKSLIAAYNNKQHIQSLRCSKNIIN